VTVNSTTGYPATVVVVRFVCGDFQHIHTTYETSCMAHTIHKFESCTDT